ncbi:32981_t:CDS:2, partial [Gigaspora margarita]
NNLEDKVAELIQIKQKEDKSVEMYMYHFDTCAEQGAANRSKDLPIVIQYKNPKDDKFKSNLDYGIDYCNHS